MPQMTGLMIEQPPRQRLKIIQQPAFLLQLPEIVGGMPSGCYHPRQLFVIDQQRVIVLNCRNGRRLGRNNLIAQPHRIGEHPEVTPAEMAAIPEAT